MSEEEQEAIWYCSEILADNENDIEHWKTVENLIDKLQKRIDELENHVHYKNCIACGKEFRTKRSDTKYCALCSKIENNRNYYLNLTEEQKAKRREQAKISMRKLRNKDE